MMDENEKIKLWNDVKLKYKKGQVIEGVVEKHYPFGIIVDINESFIKGLVQITDFLDDERMTSDKYPEIGSNIKGVVLGFTEDSRYQIWLSMKPSSFKSC